METDQCPARSAADMKFCHLLCILINLILKALALYIGHCFSQIRLGGYQSDMDHFVRLFSLVDRFHPVLKSLKALVAVDAVD